MTTPTVYHWGVIPPANVYHTPRDRGELGSP